MSTRDRAALFARAVSLPAAERRAFLAELEREDAGLARELAELLAHDQGDGPLGSAASARRSLIDSLVEELAQEPRPGPDAPTSVVLERLAEHTPVASRYTVQGEVARGGMGAILEVWDADLGRALAMKVALAQAEKDAGGITPPVDARALARFLEEAQVTGQLDHPGIVPVHELGLDRQGRVYFTMRLVKGRDLGQILELVWSGQEGWTPTRTLGVLLKVCEAMSYAHSNGVVHRDLKPANVMVGRFGEVYVMDWGLARARGRRGEAPKSERAPRAPDGQGSQGLLATRAGDILGTPCYMPPEQAAGSLEEVDERSDVYALGAMLYTLLARQMPYCRPAEHPEPRIVLARVLAGSPTPLSALAPAAPAELVAVCEKAMARDPRARYRDMGELAEDLRAFLESRVVRAYETGAWAEARKWVQRNRRYAASIVVGLLALVTGLTASLILKAQSDHNARIAKANEDRATLEKERADEEAEAARKKTDEVLRLSAIQDLDDRVAEADRLWPPYPENLERYREWLAHAERLVAALPQHEAQIASMRERIMPPSAAAQALELENHPRFAELTRAKQHLEFLEQRRAALESGTPAADPTPAEAGIDWSALPDDARALDQLAWPLVDPERSEWGAEAKGLVLARRALSLANDLPESERTSIRATLGWALFAAGRVDEALLAGEQAGTGPRGQEALEQAIESLVSSEGIAGEAQRTAALAKDVAKLEGEIAQATEPSFASGSDRWWYKQLERLVEGLRAFSNPETGLFSAGISPGRGWGVKQRLEFACTIEERSLRGAEAQSRWEEAIASVRDPQECPLYGGLVIAPQLGLVPIGRDRDSGLWEFAHLQTGELPERGPGGELRLSESTGLVLVLLPGGTFWMGAQAKDKSGQNYDPQGESDGPVHAVTLSPFFLSKYEMTQAQWLRIAGRNPSYHGPHYYDTSWNTGHRRADLLHPVERVSWSDCHALCRQLGLILPSEARWEYAARAGTQSIWSTGDAAESLQGFANIADRTAQSAGAPWGAMDTRIEDGNVVHASVGEYRPNPFGLYDVHGNLSEWCLDGFDVDYYTRSPRRDPVANPNSKPSRIYRGGSFGQGAVQARSAYRENGTIEATDVSIGLRPARALEPAAGAGER